MPTTPLQKLNLTPEDLKASLRNWRKRTGYTQELGAQVIGISYPTYLRWEAGRGNPRQRMVVQRLMELKII